ncbi:MAG TPA: hypothetical protein V6D15_17100 [Oculatellaceae cyanobacterium]|jgi:hypothetical protein
MNENIQNMTNSELKAYIKANRHNESTCHEAIKLLISRRNENNPKYHYNLPDEDMEVIFQEKLQSKQ